MYIVRGIGMILPACGETSALPGADELMCVLHQYEHITCPDNIFWLVGVVKFVRLSCRISTALAQARQAQRSAAGLLVTAHGTLRPC